MPFGLTKAPASFQDMIDTICNDMERYILYLNDILIHGSNTKAEYHAIVEKVHSNVFNMD